MKERMKSSPHDPYELGYTCATMVITKRSNNASLSYAQKNHLSSDYRLKLAYMKLELLVIANKDVAVKMSLDLVHTARHRLKVGLS